MIYMNSEFIAELFEIVLIPLLGILVKFFIDFLIAKKDEVKTYIKNDTAKKYIDLITDTITKCVIATNQTYVDTLKEQGSFDEQAQYIAFQKTYEAVMSLLTDEAKGYVSELTGDINTYVIQLIEAAVKEQKNKGR